MLLALRAASHRLAVLFLAISLGTAAATEPARAQAVSEEEIAAGFATLQVLLAGPLSAREQGRIRAEIATRSRSEPAEVKEEMAGLAALAAQMETLPGLGELSAFRQILLAAIFQEAERDPGQLEYAAVQILLNRLGPVAWNSGDGTFFALTDAQVLLWLIGGDPADGASVAAVAARMQEAYPTLAQEERLAMGSLHFAYALGLFADYVPPVAGASAQDGSPEGAPMEPWAYEVMSEMMTDMHITTLNIIENIGDSGDYWEWQPTPDYW